MRFEEWNPLVNFYRMLFYVLRVGEPEGQRQAAIAPLCI
jgi:hypothetical protein